MAAAGPVILFIVALAGSGIVGCCLVPYLSHLFLSAVEEASAGNDQVRWPDEPIVDLLGKPIYLAWLLSTWLVLGWGVLSLAAPAFLESIFGWAVLIFLDIWLFFPVSLYSTFSAHSMLFLPHWPLLRRLLLHIKPLLLLYALTLVSLLAGFGLVYLAIFGNWAFLLASAALLGPVVMVHGRLLGWYGRLLAQAQLKTGMKKRKKARNPEPWNLPKDEPAEPVPPVLSGVGLSPLPSEGIMALHTTGVVAGEIRPLAVAPGEPVLTTPVELPLVVPGGLDQPALAQAIAAEPEKSHPQISAPLPSLDDDRPIALQPLELKPVPEEPPVDKGPYTFAAAPVPIASPAATPAEVGDGYDLAEMSPLLKPPVPLDGYRPIMRLPPEETPSLSPGSLAAFLFHERNLRPWLTSTILALVELALLRLMVYTAPV